MAKTAIQPEGLYIAGIYTPAFRVSGELIFCSGVVGVDADGITVPGDAGAQTRQALENLKLVLETAGASLDDVVNMTVFTSDMANRDLINAARLEFFSEPLPASTHVEVSRFVREDWLLEIQAVAAVG